MTGLNWSPFSIMGDGTLWIKLGWIKSESMTAFKTFAESELGKTGLKLYNKNGNEVSYRFEQWHDKLDELIAAFRKLSEWRPGTA